MLRGRAARLWAEVLPKLPWLHRLDRHCLAMWCVLQAEFERDPPSMMAARVSLLRLPGLGPRSHGRRPGGLGFTMAPPAEPDPYLD